MKKESKVNVYGAGFDRILKSASGSYISDIEGNKYFDLFSSAGACNFGHNHPQLKNKLIEYLKNDGLVHGLDYYTESKSRFIDLMEKLILPKSAKDQYHYFFSPPAGTLAIEAAIKYARKFTSRRELACFTNGFHGLTYNALSITGNVNKRQASYCDLQSVMRLPYEGYYGPHFDYMNAYRKAFEDRSSGYSLPAAMVFETIQAEGGCHSASQEWYRNALLLCRDYGIISIVDDIQAGCGRTGDYFSFSAFGDLWPDVICLSKSISGLGIPMSLVMMRKELDVLGSGENSGTFRGNCLAVESAANALELFVQETFQHDLRVNMEIMNDFIGLVETSLNLEVRGRGFLRGIVLPDKITADKTMLGLRQNMILSEFCGGAPLVLKLMPPLTTPPDLLRSTLQVVFQTIKGSLK